MASFELPPPPDTILRRRSLPGRAGRIVHRRTYTFSGHVQGVGFRYTARGVASGYPVTGFVRNLPDGRVEMVIEGDAGDLEALAADLGRKMEGFIKRVDVSESPATGEFTGFSVRH